MERYYKVIRIVLGVLTLGFGAYKWFESKSERLPTFFDDNIKVKIVSKDLVESAPLKIFGIDDQPIKSNIYSTKFYFFNQGKEPIKRENVLKDILIQIADKKAKVLDFKLIKISRDVTEITLVRDTLDERTLKIDFRILEENDGCVGQVIYQSESDTDLIINGTIEGSRDVFLNEMKFSFSRVSVTVLITLLLSIALVALVFVLFFRTEETIIVKGLKKPQKKLVSNWLTTQYHLIIRNENNWEEKTSLRFRYSSVIWLSVVFFTGLFMLSLFMSSTILSKWFDPKQPTEVVIPDTLK